MLADFFKVLLRPSESLLEDLDRCLQLACLIIRRPRCILQQVVLLPHLRQRTLQIKYLLVLLIQLPHDNHLLFKWYAFLAALKCHLVQLAHQT